MQPDPTTQPLTDETIQEMLALFERSFKDVRSYILENAGKVSSTDKKDGSPVTDIDVEVERRVTVALSNRFPDIPVYGEEAGYKDNLPRVCWLLDPIDGTRSFIANRPYFTCMAALIFDDEPVASIIYNPSSGDLFVAQKNKGAYKNGVQINLGDLPLPAVAYCKGRFAAELSKMLEPQSVICEPGVGGGGHEFSIVADGTIAARFSMASGGSPHDYAPGTLLITEAGGVIIPIKQVEKPYKLSTFVACHPALESIVREHIDEIIALEDSLV